jgi:hypothetical protein
MTPPTPAPELKKLDYFTGTWGSEAIISPGPLGTRWEIQRYGQSGMDEKRNNGTNILRSSAMLI